MFNTESNFVTFLRKLKLLSPSNEYINSEVLKIRSSDDFTSLLDFNISLANMI